VESVENKALTLKEYEQRACRVNQFKGKDTALQQLSFGLFSEVGSVLALVKKSYRDLQPADLKGLCEELGDALWYLTTCSIECNSSLEEVGAQALTELQDLFGVNAKGSKRQLTFSEFDGLAAFSRSQLPEGDKLMRLQRLGTHCGHLLTHGSAPDLAAGSALKVLSETLAGMVLVGALYGQTFTKIASANLLKIESRWPPEDTQYLPLFDEGRTELERFPRKFSIRFIQLTKTNGKPTVIQQMHGVNIGDRLTDNRTQSDGYRFHDVFHLSYLVHLGWSPVIRALLRLKRKSDPDIDENQDGARAIIIEEGIATWIFNHAHRRGNFTDIDVGRLDYNMLKQVLDMVEGFEVEKCPMWQWERAILDGFKVFRQLLASEGGTVHVDLEARTLKFDQMNEVAGEDGIASFISARPVTK
jgi:NTP pyrophosphatase (non-canonical NTP hydrolase)